MTGLRQYLRQKYVIDKLSVDLLGGISGSSNLQFEFFSVNDRAACK